MRILKKKKKVDGLVEGGNVLGKREREKGCRVVSRGESEVGSISWLISLSLGTSSVVQEEICSPNRCSTPTPLTLQFKHLFNNALDPFCLNRDEI